MSTSAAAASSSSSPSSSSSIAPLKSGGSFHWSPSESEAASTTAVTPLDVPRRMAPWLTTARQLTDSASLAACGLIPNSRARLATSYGPRASIARDARLDMMIPFCFDARTTWMALEMRFRRAVASAMAAEYSISKKMPRASATLTCLGLTKNGSRFERSSEMMSTSIFSQACAHSRSVVGVTATMSNSFIDDAVPLRRCATDGSASSTVTRESTRGAAPPSVGGAAAAHFALVDAIEASTADTSGGTLPTIAWSSATVAYPNRCSIPTVSTGLPLNGTLKSKNAMIGSAFPADSTTLSHSHLT
eukprot:m.142523 g.142523  ORF g.142523 m.142523 type:complete len:304 (-) comp22927_c1_seq1:253-1164(-)